MVIDFDPVLVKLGPIEVRYYGLMYVLGFVLGTYILKRLCRSGFLKVDEKYVDNYVTWLIVGMVIGARTFFVFIYNWEYYSKHLMESFAVWQGGLSFHGAVVGMSVATYLFAKKHKLHFFEISDSMAIAGTPGLFLGRMGNFINGELYGRITDSPVGMVFKNGGPYPRHASQLYEGIFEGLVLFCILYFVHKRAKYYGIISSLFIIGYGVFRYFIEFFREPDVQLGYYFGGTTTMGQILCFIMILIGFGVMAYARKAKIKINWPAQK